MTERAGRPLMALTAEDLMTSEVCRLAEEMPLREAARLLVRNQVGGAPVVDARGQCVGVLSAIDFVRLAGKPEGAALPASTQGSAGCVFQIMSRAADGRETALCTLPPGVCPIQVKRPGAAGNTLVVCGQPHCVLVDWQVVDFERLPDGEVRRFMTADPVTVGPRTPIRTLAAVMVEAHIHRVIVVDEARRPVGVVSATDLLAALARCGCE